MSTGNIPEITLKHHERLDGSGYPSRLAGREQIPIQARILALADVFDALSAADRPYKKRVSLQQVLAILQSEGDANKLDPDLVGLFISERLYEPETDATLTSAEDCLRT